MIRHLAIATLAAVALSGCVSDYAYRDGPGDYYYGRPSVQYYDYGYGAPYGSAYGYGYPGGWSGSLYYGGGYGYGYPYGYYGGGYYPYYPYYWHRRHDNHRPPPDDSPRPVTGGRLPPNRYTGPHPPIPAQVRPQEGARPMRPPVAGGAWRDGPEPGDAPRAARPSMPMVRPPQSRGPTVAPRPAPRMSAPSRPAPRANFPERERVREREQ